MKVERRVLFEGRVQGVCFRSYTQQYAKELGLTGSVKNLPNGTVEMVAQGEEEDIKALVEKLKGASGPGHVTQVYLHDRPFSTPYSSFDILYA